jgi:hypothetical protein
VGQTPRLHAGNYRHQAAPTGIFVNVGADSSAPLAMNLHIPITEYRYSSQLFFPYFFLVGFETLTTGDPPRFHTFRCHKFQRNSASAGTLSARLVLRIMDARYRPSMTTAAQAELAV